MAVISLWIDLGLTSDGEISTRLLDVAVAVVDLGDRSYVQRRVAFIQDQFRGNASSGEVAHLHLAVGRDGRVCTHETDTSQFRDQYDQFDVLFHQDLLDVTSLYQALAQLVRKWRGRGKPAGCLAASSIALPHLGAGG
jgi:hypothetical protein